MMYRSPNTHFGRGTLVVDYGLPAWVPAPNTVGVIPEANSFASIDPGSSGPNGWSYNQAGVFFPKIWNKIIDDYSGGVYNPHLGIKGSMIYHGGGHAASNWNGIVAFDLDTLLYSIWMGGCTNCYPLQANGEYADFQPASPHSYDVLQIVGPEAGYPKGALITAVTLAAAFESTGTNAVHIFDFAHPELKWVRLSDENPAFARVPGGTAAYDPYLNRVWWVVNSHQLGYQQYFDLSLKKHVKVVLGYTNSVQGGEAGSHQMRYHAGRKLLVRTDFPSNFSVRRVWYFDTMNPSLGWAQATLGGTPFPVPAGEAFALSEAPDGSYICYSRLTRSTLYRLSIPTTLTDPWPVTSITPAGALLDTAAVIGGRWSYVPALQSIVCKFAGASVHQIYRL